MKVIKVNVVGLRKFIIRLRLSKVHTVQKLKASQWLTTLLKTVFKIFKKCIRALITSRCYRSNKHQREFCIARIISAENRAKAFKYYQTKYSTYIYFVILTKRQVVSAKKKLSL